MVAYKPLQESSAFRLWCKAHDLNIKEYDEIAKNLENYENDPKWKDLIEGSKKFRGVIESVAPSPCFPAGTLVQTSTGYKEIQNIQRGDYVLTHKNEFKKVLNTMNRHSDKAVELTFQGSAPFATTPNHPFYIRHKEGTIRKKNKEGVFTSKRKFSDPEWVHAEDIKKGDYVGIAINQNSIIPTWNGVHDCGINKDIKNIDVKNPDFWWIIGRYFGDGWSQKYTCKNGNVGYYRFIICCNKNNNDEEYITRKIKSIGFKYSVTKERTVKKITVSSKELFIFVDQFGHGAKNKRLTNTIFDLPVNLLRNFLEGYFSADGHYIKDTKKEVYSTISKELAYGIEQCVYKVYHTPCAMRTKNGQKTQIEGRIVNTNTAYDVRFKFEPGRSDQGFYENGYMWLPFRSMKTIDYDGTVYNLSVQDDESYTVNNFIVHNCSFLLSNDKISEMVGLIKVGEEICCCLDGYNCDVYKFLKND